MTAGGRYACINGQARSWPREMDKQTIVESAVKHDERQGNNKIGRGGRGGRQKRDKRGRGLRRIHYLRPSDAPRSGRLGPPSPSAKLNFHSLTEENESVVHRDALSNGRKAPATIRRIALTRRDGSSGGGGGKLVKRKTSRSIFFHGDRDRRVTGLDTRCLPCLRASGAVPVNGF